MAAKETFLTRFDRCEGRVCATGTAWGLLKPTQPIAMLLWYGTRHSVYFGLVIYLVLVEPLGTFFNMVTIPTVFFVVYGSWSPSSSVTKRIRS